MKMKLEHYKELEAAVNKVLTDRPNLRKIYIHANATFSRFCWDVFWASGYNLKTLYDYLNDSHINTAMAKILNKEAYEKGE